VDDLKWEHLATMHDAAYRWRRPAATLAVSLAALSVGFWVRAFHK
jgi:hypothetical protein